VGEKLVRVREHERRAPREREPKEPKESLIEKAARQTYEDLKEGRRGRR
jgi:hypothetical protein